VIEKDDEAGRRPPLADAIAFVGFARDNAVRPVCAGVWAG